MAVGQTLQNCLKYILQLILSPQILNLRNPSDTACHQLEYLRGPTNKLRGGVTGLLGEVRQRGLEERAGRDIHISCFQYSG